MVFSHGSNDAQKSMGIFASALFAAQLIPTLHVPKWVVLIAATAMGLGTASGGWRIIKTMGHKMVKLNPLYGFVAETSAAIVIETGVACVHYARYLQHHPERGPQQRDEGRELERYPEHRLGDAADDSSQRTVGAITFFVTRSLVALAS